MQHIYQYYDKLNKKDALAKRLMSIISDTIYKFI